MPDPAADPSGTVRPPDGLSPSVILGKAASNAMSVAGDWSPAGFAIETELGRGGMGVVYLAHQAGLNRPVALKLIKADDADSVSVLRFLAEAEAMAAVRHPNVAQVYQYGEHRGRPFLALEYCGGGSLYDRIKATGKLPPAAAATLVAAVADGVQAAHAAGIVHRDLKPANVLFDVAGVPKVTDFGLAKRNAGDHLTQTDAVMGTPAYMSPEQARGQGKFADPRMDVWALGVMLYELLSGRRPFQGDTPLDLLQEVVEGTPADIRSLSASVPRDLGLICDKCLRKDAAERYATAGEAAADVRRFLAGEPVLAKRTTAAVQAWKWARRNKVVASSLAGTVTALVLGIVVSVVFAAHARTEAKRADDRTEDAREAAEREKERADEAKAASALAAEASERADAEAVAARAGRVAATRTAARLTASEGVRLADTSIGNRTVAWFARSVELTPDDELAVQRLTAHLTHGGLPVLTRIDLPDNLDRQTRLEHDNRLIRVVNDNGSYAARVVDATTGQPVIPYLSHPRPVRGASFSPDGRRVATASDDRTARVWDAATGTPVTPPLVHADAVSDPVFSPDGRRVVTICADGTIRVWSATTGHPLTPPLPSIGAWVAKWTPGGWGVVTSEGSDIGRVWDIETVAAGPYRSFDIGPGYVRTFSRDGRWAVVVAADKTARVWNVTSGTPASPPLPTHDPFSYKVVISSDGRRAATLVAPDRVQVWDVETGRAVGEPLRSAGPIRQVELVADSQFIFTLTDKEARLSDLTTGRSVGPRIAFDEPVRRAEVSGDGQLLAVTTQDMVTRLFRTDTGAASGPDLKGALADWTTLSPDRRFGLTDREVGTIQVWNLASGMPADRALTHGGLIRTATFTSDSRRVATASEDRTARVWDADTGRPITPPLAHDGHVTAVEFSPDGRRVSTASADRTARVWDAETGLPISPPFPHPGRVWHAQFSTDGTDLITCCEDGRVRTWDISPGTAPSAVLIDFARLYAGGRIDESGGFVPLTAVETKWLFAKLRGRYSADFTVTPTQAAAWHREQVEEAERDKDGFAVAFHLRVLLQQYAFADVDLAVRLRAAEPKGRAGTPR